MRTAIAALSLLCAWTVPALLHAGAGEAAEAEPTVRESDEPRERPVLFDRNGAQAAPGPIFAGHGLAPWAFQGPGSFGYHPYLYPAPYTPAVGRSTVWFAAGSHGYLGGGFHTLQPIEDTRFAYGIAISHEQGKTWFSRLNYRRDSISPYVEWHGERTAVHVGATVADTTLAGTARPRTTLGIEPPAENDRPAFSVDDRFLYREIRAGIRHRVFDNLDVSFHVRQGRERLRD